MTAFTRTLLMFRIGLSRQTTAYSLQLNDGLMPRHRGDALPVRTLRLQLVGLG